MSFMIRRESPHELAARRHLMEVRAASRVAPTPKRPKQAPVTRAAASSKPTPQDAMLALLGELEARLPQRPTPVPVQEPKPALKEFDENLSAGGSARLARGLAGKDWPFREDEAVHEAVEAVARTRPREFNEETDMLELVPAREPRVRRNIIRFYRPQDGHQAGALFWFRNRNGGEVLAQCRGTLHHVMSEAEKFAKAQGCTIADLIVEIAEAASEE